MASKLPGELIKIRIAGPTPVILDSEGQRGLKICPFPTDLKEMLELLVQGITLGEPLGRKVLSFFFFLNKFIYLLFLAVLGLRCCTRAFSSCGKQGLLFVAVRGLQ